MRAPLKFIEFLLRHAWLKHEHDYEAFLKSKEKILRGAGWTLEEFDEAVSKEFRDSASHQGANAPCCEEEVQGEQS